MSVPAAFKYSEGRLAACVGVSRADLKTLRDRNLTVDRDWKKVAGEVALNNSGLRRIWRALGIKPSCLDLRDCLISAPQKKNGATNGHEDASPPEKILLGHRAMPIPTVMRVTRIPDNPSLVLCHDQHARPWPVWVGRNAHFVVGMQLNAAQGGDGMWRLQGPLPRLRGRWT